MEEAELLKQFNKKAKIFVAPDGLKAILTLFAPEQQEETHTMEEIHQLIDINRITYGVDEDIIEDAIKNKLYYKDLIIAKGVEPIEGKPGKYEFCFDIDPETKPIILEDGSVDYNVLGRIQLVKKGDLLAHYKKSVPGIDGMSIHGKPILAKPCKDLPTIKGKGFHVTEDETEYIADLDGKIEYKGGKLTVQNLFVIEEDVDVTTGDVEFNGDVLVQGNVCSGMTVRAAGNITVNGSVEAAILVAGKGILLRNGMQGQEKGIIRAKGDVAGKFFELCAVKTKGKIMANAVMNSNLESGEDIIVSGSKGVIIGGVTKAIGIVTAATIGNRTEILSKVMVGIDGDFANTMQNIDEKIVDFREKLQQSEDDLMLISKRLQKNPIALLQDKRMELLRLKIELKARLTETMSMRDEFIHNYEKSKDSKVIVLRTAYAGCRIHINKSMLNLSGTCQDVTFRLKGEDVCIFSNK